MTECDFHLNHEIKIQITRFSLVAIQMSSGTSHTKRSPQHSTNFGWLKMLLVTRWCHEKIFNKRQIHLDIFLFFCMSNVRILIIKIIFYWRVSNLFYLTIVADNIEHMRQCVLSPPCSVVDWLWKPKISLCWPLIQNMKKKCWYCLCECEKYIDIAICLKEFPIRMYFSLSFLHYVHVFVKLHRTAKTFCCYLLSDSLFKLFSKLKALMRNCSFFPYQSTCCFYKRIAK